MSKPQISFHTLYNVLFQIEMKKYDSMSYGKPVVWGLVCEHIKRIPYTKDYEVADVAYDTCTLVPELEMPAIIIHPHSLNQMDENNISSSSFRLQYPIENEKADCLQGI